jgi:ankyrin repeat protein
MSRQLTSQSSLEHLRREAKRWHRALRQHEPAARARFVRAHPDAPNDATLRDVQHALARELGFPGWPALKEELRRRTAAATPDARAAAVQSLLAAADRGDARGARDVLEAHSDIVNERAVLPGHTGRRSALHFAMNSASEEVVDALLARGADPNTRDEGDHAMPLHFAVERGHFGIVRRLIEHGADPIGAGDLHDLEIIGWATVFARRPHPELVAYLLAHGARHNILSAVATGAVAEIREIVRRDPGQRDRIMDATNHRRRPLHLAVVRGQPEALAALIELGAHVEAEDAAGLTPLDQAALAGERAMADRLLTAGATIRLAAAVALDRQAEVERLLREDPHALRPGGRWERLLIRASEGGSAQVIESLLRAGASVYARDDHRIAVDGTHGYTALHAAAFHGNVDAVRVLLRHGANPADREDKYWGTPAGWANYANHTAARDLILDGAIDIFDAIQFDRHGRLDTVLREDPLALERPFGEYVNGDRQGRVGLDAAWTPLAYAVANGRPEAVRLLLERGADRTVRDSAGRSLHEIAEEHGDAEIVRLLDETPPAERAPRRRGGSVEERAADFLRLASLDWRHGGAARIARMHDAGRILERHPEVARANIFTSVVCGELEDVRRRLDARPEAANEIGGPRSWPPLLYLCAARLPQRGPMEHAAAMARLLLDRGADPNAFYLGGNADIHYTALTFVLGRGEELASMHPQARELVRLLLERGADPHDNQVLYNVFADNTSRHLLDEEIVWLLEMMYEHSLRRGHEADWEDGRWPMFDMRGAPSLGDGQRRHHGAHFMLLAAIDRNLLGVAEWMLRHGADPNTPWGTHPPSDRTLHQEALVRRREEMARLLVRCGAEPRPLAPTPLDVVIDAALRMDVERVRELARGQGDHAAHRALVAAIAGDRADVLEMLLDLGASPDAEDAEHGGARLLHAAAAGGAERCAALLIARGADVDWRESTYGGTPLGWATYFQREPLIALLGAHSRDVWNLVFNGLVDRLRAVLAEDSARARVTSAEAGTPLMWLPDDGGVALAAASLLLAHGADPQVRDARGRTAAQVAEERGMADVASLLRERGG